MPLLFSYGTLQQPPVQQSTFGRLLQGQPDELPGYEQSFAWIKASLDETSHVKKLNANVKFNGKSDSRISGTLYEITEAELAAADVYENLDDYYRVEVTLGSGRRAWVYACTVT